MRWPPAGLGAVVLSGTVDGMAGGERTQLLAAIGSRLAPGGTLVIHSVSPAAWDAADAPPEADLAPGRPLRPEAWCQPPGAERVRGDVAQPGPSGSDFLVTAVRAAIVTPYPPAER